MRTVRVSEDIVPVREFQARAFEWLKRVEESGQPVVLTHNGQAAGVLLSPAEYDRLTERTRFVEAASEGLADSNEERLTLHDAVVARMRERLGRG